MKIVKTTIEASGLMVAEEINTIFNSVKLMSNDKAFLSVSELKKELSIKLTDLQLARYFVSIGGKVTCAKEKYFLHGWFKPFWIVGLTDATWLKYRFLYKKEHAELSKSEIMKICNLNFSEMHSVRFRSEIKAVEFELILAEKQFDTKVWQYADFS